MTLDLTDDETRALVGLLRRAADEEHTLARPAKGDPCRARSTIGPARAIAAVKPGLMPTRGGGKRRWGG
jgi:hypothetical protein